METHNAGDDGLGEAELVGGPRRWHDGVAQCGAGSVAARGERRTYLREVSSVLVTGGGRRGGRGWSGGGYKETRESGDFGAFYSALG